MPENKIIDLTQYRQDKAQAGKDSDPSNKKDPSFEEKLKDFIHRPQGEPGSINELIAIFEEEQLKKDRDDGEE